MALSKPGLGENCIYFLQHLLFKDLKRSKIGWYCNSQPIRRTEISEIRKEDAEWFVYRMYCRHCTNGGGISQRRISLQGNLLRKKSPYREIFLGRNLLIGKSSRDKTLVTGKYLTELLYRFFSLNSFFILANSFCQSWNEEIGDRRGGRRQRRK